MHWVHRSHGHYEVMTQLGGLGKSCTEESYEMFTGPRCWADFWNALSKGILPWNLEYQKSVRGTFCWTRRERIEREIKWKNCVLESAANYRPCVSTEMDMLIASHGQVSPHFNPTIWSRIPDSLRRKQHWASQILSPTCVVNVEIWILGTENRRVYGLCTSSGIINEQKIRFGNLICFQWLRLVLSKGPTWEWKQIQFPKRCDF
jgi:hypothetical protein